MGGNTVSIDYIAPLGEKKEGETPIYRAMHSKDQLTDCPEPGLTTMKVAMDNSFKLHAANNCLGSIVR